MSDIVDAHLEWMKGERYQERNYSERSIRDRRKVLNHADRHLPRGLFDVYPDDIKAYLSNPDWARWTSHTYFSHLAGAYRWWYANG